jgi:hypothetical protein
VILNILARKKDPGSAVTIATPEALRLKHVPAADCARYDSLRRVSLWNGPTFSPDGRAKALRHARRLR